MSEPLASKQQAVDELMGQIGLDVCRCERNCGEGEGWSWECQRGRRAGVTGLGVNPKQQSLWRHPRLQPLGNQEPPID